LIGTKELPTRPQTISPHLSLRERLTAQPERTLVWISVALLIISLIASLPR
jgi:hypothetical protein